MNKEYLTVKEYAEIKGCSTQYVYKLLQTKLQPFVELVEGRKVLKIEVLEDSVANQVANKSTKVANSFATELQTENNTPSSSDKINEEELLKDKRRNEELIDDLRAQIKEKDEQIKNQSEHIIELSNRITELFDNNQKLQLNYQYLLGNGTEQNNEEVNIKENVEGARPYEEVKKESTRKGLLKRLLRK